MGQALMYGIPDKFGNKADPNGAKRNALSKKILSWLEPMFRKENFQKNYCEAFKRELPNCGKVAIDITKNKGCGYTGSCGQYQKCIDTTTAPFYRCQDICIVEFYQHVNYKGVKSVYSKDTNRVARNDDMSSLKVGDGCCAVIYEHYNFEGKSQKYCGSTTFVGKLWNDKVSSVKVVMASYKDEEVEDVKKDEDDVEDIATDENAEDAEDAEDVEDAEDEDEEVEE